MTSFLGPRGKLATAIVATVALAASLLSIVQGDWAAAAGLAVLGLTWVVAAGTWGVVRAAHDRHESLEQKVNRMRRQPALQKGAANPDVAKLRAAVDKLTDDVNKIAVRLGGAQTDTFGARSLEQRYAGVLTQPASVPNSQLLTYLELLAKDATTRRADMAAIHEILAELRQMRESQDLSYRGLS